MYKKSFINKVVRLFLLGYSYDEISLALDVPNNVVDEILDLVLPHL